MADAEYDGQAKVYVKQGAAEAVIADGGTVDVESGGEIDIQSGGAVDVESGGEINIESSGEMDVESGGKIHLESGGEFQFYSTDFTADKMENFMRSFETTTIYANGSKATLGGSTVLGLNSTTGSVLQISFAYGYYYFSVDASATAAIAALPYPDSGCVLYLNGTNVASGGSVTVRLSGAASAATIINQISISLSSLTFNGLSDANAITTSVPRGCYRLICIRAGEWSVVESRGLGIVDGIEA